MSPAPGELPADLVAEGARYAAALLDRIASGQSSPADFAAVVMFLQCHPMLYGFAAVMLDTLSGATLAPREARH